MSFFKTFIVSAITFLAFLQQSEAGPCRPRQPGLLIQPAQISIISGQSATVTISIRNNDRNGCPASTFDLSISNSASISVLQPVSQARLLPGQSTSTQLTVISAVAGTHQVLVTLADKDGAAPSHENISGSVQVVVTAPPAPAPSYSLTISSPAAGATVAGTTQFVGSGPGFLNVEITSSSGALLGRGTPSSTGAFSIAVNTTSLANGSQVFTITAWDAPAGQAFTHTAQATRSLNVQNLAPAPTPAPTPIEVPVYADGTSRINNLLNSSLNVVLQSGVYMITGELNVRDGHVISAATGAQVTLKAADAYTGLIMAPYEERITVRGITFDGNYSKRLTLEGNVNASLVRITGSSNVTFENNKFQYAPSFAIWNYRSALIQVRGNTFLECYHPIRLDSSNQEAGVIESNTFQNTAAYKSIQHIEAVATTNLVIRGNTMAGVGLQEPTNHGYEGTWGNSIYIWNSTGHLVENNKVYKNYWSALVSGAGATYGIIRNNYFSDGTVGGNSVWIEQPGAGYITLDGNEMDGGMLIGDGGGDHSTITNNIIRTSGQGIDVSFAAKDILIQGNRIYSKAGFRNNNGLYLWEKSTPDVNVRVLNNHIEGFDKGIAINNYGGVGYVYGITLSGNTFNNNNQNVWIPSQIILDKPLGQ